MFVRFLLLLVTWLLRTSAAVLVTFVVGSLVKTFWGKPMVDIFKELKEEEEEEDD